MKIIRHCLTCRHKIDDDDSPIHTRDGWLCSQCAAEEHAAGRRHGRTSISSLAEPDTWTLEQYRRWEAAG